MVRTNGAFVAGYELRGILAYFATDGDRNQNKSMLEALFRSVPDVSMRVQFRYEISEHLGDLLNSYIHEQRTEQSEVMALDSIGSGCGGRKRTVDSSSKIGFMCI